MGKFVVSFLLFILSLNCYAQFNHYQDNYDNITEVSSEHKLKKLNFSKGIKFIGTTHRVKTSKKKYEVPFTKGTLYLIDRTDYDTIKVEGTWETNQIGMKSFCMDVENCTIKFPSSVIATSKKAHIEILKEKNESFVFIQLDDPDIKAGYVVLEHHSATIKDVLIHNEKYLSVEYKVDKNHNELVAERRARDLKTTLDNASFKNLQYKYDGSYIGVLKDDWINTPTIEKGYFEQGSLTLSDGNKYQGWFTPYSPDALYSYKEGALFYTDGSVYTGTFNGTSYLKGKYVSKDNDWKYGDFDANGDLKNGSMSWHFRHGFFEGTVAGDTTKGNLIVSENEQYNNAEWATNITKKPNYKNIISGTVRFKDSENFYDCVYEKGNVKNGTVKGNINTSFYDGYVNGKFQEYQFTDGDIDAEVSTEITDGQVKGNYAFGEFVNGQLKATIGKKFYDGIVKDKMFSGHYEYSDEEVSFVGTKEKDAVSGVFNLQSEDVIIEKRYDENTEMFGPDITLKGFWKKYNCIKGTVHIDSDGVLYEGTISYVNGYNKVALKKNKKKFKTITLKAKDYIDSALLGGIIKEIKKYE